VSEDERYTVFRILIRGPQGPANINMLIGVGLQSLGSFGVIVGEGNWRPRIETLQ
jgi:hypothetical protein